VTSPKRRTNSKSGTSGKSPKTATSSRTKHSSATAPASFAQVFGEPKTWDPETLRYRGLLRASEKRLAVLEEQPVPTVTLLRTRHLQRMRREEAHQRNLKEVIDSLTADQGSK